MRLGLGSSVRARRWLTALSVALACGVAVAAGTSGGGRDEADAWTALVAVGDRGGTFDRPSTKGGLRLTARQAYLLAFHRAQDTADPEHVLAVADRLDGIGEAVLASHVRWAARVLLAELGAGDGLDEDPGSPP